MPIKGFPTFFSPFTNALLQVLSGFPGQARRLRQTMFLSIKTHVCLYNPESPSALGGDCSSLSGTKWETTGNGFMNYKYIDDVTLIEF
jgi:hypothetical protein